jgi:hypothetical protein
MGLCLRLLRRQKKNPARARATTARVMATDMPATAPEDKPLFPLLSLLLLLSLSLDSLLGGSDVAVASELEPVVPAVVPAVVAVLSPVDPVGGWML